VRCGLTFTHDIAIDSPCEYEPNNPDSLDARLFPVLTLSRERALARYLKQQQNTGTVCEVLAPQACGTSWRRVCCPLWLCWDVASPCPCVALTGPPPPKKGMGSYVRRLGQPTQRATNYTARSNIEPAQTHELPALTALAQHITHHTAASMKRDRRKSV